MASQAFRFGGTAWVAPLALCAVAAVACKPKTSTKNGQGATQPATPLQGEAAATVGPKKFLLLMPEDGVLESALVLELIKQLNAGLGFDLITLAPPLATANAELAYSDGGDGEKATCVGEVKSEFGRQTGFKLTLNRSYVDRFFVDKDKLKDTELYKAFAHCVGHALGMAHVLEPGDVMNADWANSTKMGDFYNRVKVRATQIAQAVGEKAEAP